MTPQEFEELDPELRRILSLIVAELDKAMRKHSHWPDADIIHAAAIVAEESGELVRASLQYHYEGGDHAETTKEAIQTGAMAIRFLLNR